MMGTKGFCICHPNGLRGVISSNMMTSMTQFTRTSHHSTVTQDGNTCMETECGFILALRKDRREVDWPRGWTFG